MRTVFKIYNTSASAWHDYSDMVQMSGMNWKRNDLDSEGAGRTLDGVMHRAKLGEKRTLDYRIMPNRQTKYAQLDTDLSQETFQAQYEDLHGTLTKYFYCSSFSATLDYADNSAEWSGGAFTVIEV